jgi:hypothetical protein
MRADDHVVAEILLRPLPDVSEFRAPLPCVDDVQAQERHIRALGERFAALLSAPATAAQVREFQRECAFRDTVPAARVAVTGRVGALPDAFASPCDARGRDKALASRD